MELKVNGQKVDITLEGERTVGEILKAFEAEAAKNEATTINISINGEIVPAEKFEEAIQTPIEENTVIELSVITKVEIIQLLTKNGSDLGAMSEKLKDVPVLLQGSKDSEVNSILKDLANLIDAFCHAATLSALFPELYEKLSIDGKDVGSFFEEFAPVLADFEGALTDKDTVTVGDLAEYEISPRLLAISEAVKVI